MTRVKSVQPAPAAPDVQQPLQPVDPNRVHAGWNIKGEPVYLDEPLATDVASIVKRLKDRGRELFGSTLITAQDDGHLMFDAAALLAKLGQGSGECICPKCGLRHGGSNLDGGF